MNWLAAGQAAISQMFAGFGAVPMEERFARTVWETITTGAPCRADAVICFDCTVVNTIDVGSHSVIFARVVAKKMTEEYFAACLSPASVCDYTSAERQWSDSINLASGGADAHRQRVFEIA